MIDCKFKLNGKPLSFFQCGATNFPAFSGLGPHVNKREAMCIPDWGPIPPGSYYIFDRETGGLRGLWPRIFDEHSDWFALYAIDKKIDDETYCNKVRRGEFRLHPVGPRRISKGCITINSQSDFQFLRTILKKTKQEPVPGSKLLAYGKVVVT